MEKEMIAVEITAEHLGGNAVAEAEPAAVADGSLGDCGSCVGSGQYELERTVLVGVVVTFAVERAEQALDGRVRNHAVLEGTDGEGCTLVQGGNTVDEAVAGVEADTVVLELDGDVGSVGGVDDKLGGPPINVLVIFLEQGIELVVVVAFVHEERGEIRQLVVCNLVEARMGLLLVDSAAYRIRIDVVKAACNVVGEFTFAEQSPLVRERIGSTEKRRRRKVRCRSVLHAKTAD